MAEEVCNSEQTMNRRLEAGLTFPVVFVVVYVLLNLFIHLSVNKYLLGDLIEFQNGWQVVGTFGGLIIVGLIGLKFVWPHLKQYAGAKSTAAKTTAWLFTITLVVVGYNLLTFVGVFLMVLAHSLGIQE